MQLLKDNKVQQKASVLLKLFYYRSVGVFNWYANFLFMFAATIQLDSSYETK